MIKNIINMYDKDFLKQLLHPHHLGSHRTSVKNNTRHIQKLRKEFSTNKLAKNSILRKFLKLTTIDEDSKLQKNVDTKNADKKIMQYLDPKLYRSQLAHGGKVSTHSYKKVMSNFTKTITPLHVIDDHIKIARTHNMFDWFPKLVNKVHKEGINMTGKLPSLHNEVIKKLKIGNEDVYSYTKPNGSIRIDVESPYAANPDIKTKKSIFTMHYTPPMTHIDKQSDIIMSTPAEFSFHEDKINPYLGKTKENIHPNYAKSDTLPLESKLTGRHISALRNDKK
jgi:hypothetical protein